MKVLRTICLLLTVFLAACSTYSEDNLKQFDTRIEAYIKKHELPMERSETGLYYQIVQVGEGDAILANDFVSFKYVGKLLNGEIFDQHKTPVEFQVTKLIAAWQEIMFMLKPGGKAILVAPPQLAYGTTELEDIPENSILYFEIEVVSVK